MENWGGGELFLLDLVNNVNGFDFLIASPPGKAFEKLKQSKAKLIAINNIKKFYRKENKWLLKDSLKILFKLAFISVKLIKIILSGKTDIILANGNFAALYSFLPAKFTKRKLVIVQHLLYNKNTLEAKLTSFIGKRADKLICVSNAVASRTRAIIKNGDDELIKVIYNGVEIPPIEIVSNQKEIIDIGFAGSIVRIKGIDMIIKAVKPLLLENENLRLHIYGTTSNDEDSIHYKDEVKTLIDKSVENKILFHGHVDSKDKIYKEIDILISFSSIPESFGYNIAEAMAHGKIVIAANAGGTKELISDGETGFLVEPKNIDELREKIQYCIDNFNSEPMNNLRFQARQTIKENFSIKSFAGNYEQIFKSLTG